MEKDLDEIPFLLIFQISFSMLHLISDICVTDLFIHIYLLRYGNHFHLCSWHAVNSWTSFEFSHTVCVLAAVWCALIPVAEAVGAAGRGPVSDLEQSAEGGRSREGFPAAPPAAGYSPRSPAGHTAPPAETTNHTLVKLYRLIWAISTLTVFKRTVFLKLK